MKFTTSIRRHQLTFISSKKSFASRNKFHLFVYLIPYNPGLNIFSEKPSGSNDGPYCPTLMQKIGRSLELFWRKGKNHHIDGQVDGMTDRMTQTDQG